MRVAVPPLAWASIEATIAVETAAASAIAIVLRIKSSLFLVPVGGKAGGTRGRLAYASRRGRFPYSRARFGSAAGRSRAEMGAPTGARMRSAESQFLHIRGLQYHVRRWPRPG